MEQPPLQSPSKQQAHDKIRGYAFQCWLTVDAWLRLKTDDRLYVECAEDFAVIAKDAAEVAQAKAVAAAISLRSEDAVEAINHLWAFQHAGYAGKIRYSFLTTGGIVVEKGDPFVGESGIDLWRSATAECDEAKAEKLRAFLASDDSVRGKLDKPVREYLEKATAKDFLETMVIPLVWDTGRPDETEVRAAVEGRLAAMASRDYAASPLNAATLADTLFTAIVKVASSKEKIALTRIALLEKIQEALMPQATAMRAARQQEVFGGLVAAGAGLAPEWAHTSALPPIQPADEYSPRTEALATLQKKIGATPFAVLTGSTGTGKTTLAQLFSAAEGGTWLQFQAKEVRRAVRVIQECMAVIDQRAPKLSLIIDDLPWEKLDGGASTALRGFAWVVRRSGGRVLFTNQRPPTAQELAAAGMSAALVLSAPAFTRGEIAEVAVRLGCPQQKLAEAWAVFVLGQTLGHPQLVHAQLLALKARQWPALSAAELQATAKDVQDERARRQVLLAELVSGESELLRRVSVYFGTFRRDQVLTLAQQLSPIANAGAFFERLRGPWIEPVTREYYQLSPLIHHSLLEGLSAEHLRELHSAAVESVITTEPVQAADACNALFNAVEGLAAEKAEGIMGRLLSAPHEHGSTLRQLLHWVIWIKPDGTPIFPGAARADLLFRLLQFDVASELAPKRCADFLKYCDAIVAAEKNRDAASGAHCIALMAYLLVRIDAPTVPVARLFWCARIMKRESAVMRAGAPLTGEPAPGLGRGATRADEVDFFISTRILSEETGEYRLQELLSTLEEAAPETRAEYLAVLGRFKAGVLMAFDRLWLAEDKKTQQSWDAMLALYGRFLTRALEWKNELLATAAARAAAIVEHEYRNDVPAAVALLDRVTPADPELSAALDEQRGNIALVEKRYADAQVLFERCTVHNAWADISKGNLVNCHQKAGTAAGHLRRWPDSARHFETGCQLAADEKDDLDRFGQLADAAFARWQNGEKPKAVSHLVAAMALTSRLPDPGTDLRALRALKCFGHLLHQLAWRKYGRTDPDSGVILPGMCSDPRPNQGLKELPAPVVPFDWVLLLWLDFEQTPNSGLWEKVAPELRQSRLLMLRHYFEELEVRRLLADRKYDEILGSAIKMATTYVRTKRLGLKHPWQAEDPNDVTVETFAFDGPMPMPLLLLPALTLAITRGEVPTALLEGWRKAAVGTQVEAGALVWLRTVETIFADSLPAALHGAAQEPDVYLRWAHALRILHQETVYPDALLAATMYFALLPYTSTHYAWLIEMTVAVDELCSKKWLAACERRFDFKSPTLFIPDLKALAANPRGNPAHLAELALAARPALLIKVPSEMIDQLKARAKGAEVATTGFPMTPLA